MGMNPDTNKMEQLQQLEALQEQLQKAEQKQVAADLSQLVRPNGEPVPKHWSVFRVGKNYVINNYTFKCAYIGETSILFEPVGPVVLGEQNSDGT
jgi:hypothetical protein